MQTYTLSTTLLTVDGDPIVGAIMTATLDRVDYTTDGTVLPTRVTGVSNSDGLVSVDIISNLIGTRDSRYLITIKTSYGASLASATIQMPEANVDLESLVDLPPIIPNYTTAAAISAAKAEEEADRAQQIVDDAEGDINDVRDAAIVSVNNTRDAAIEDVNDTRDAAIVSVNDTRDSAIASITPLVQDAQDAADAANADRIQTGLDRVQTGEDRVQTGLDREQTGLDRVQTGADLDQMEILASQVAQTDERINTLFWLGV